MNKLQVLGLGLLVVGLSSMAIRKILELPTTSCTVETAELTRATDLAATTVFAPKELVEELRPALSQNTYVDNSTPYVAIAGLAKDMTTVYVKILIDESANYSGEAEQEVKQLKSIMHKDETQCSMGGKKYDIYRAKTTMPRKASHSL